MMYYSCLVYLGFALATTAFPGVDKQVKEWSFYITRGTPVHLRVRVEAAEDETQEIAGECINDDDCPDDRQCLWNSCEDPCLTETVCRPNTVCYVSDHVASCYCKRGFYGDPHIGCNEEAISTYYFEVTDGRFYVKDSHYINFTSARDECTRRGLHLATFRDESDYDQLKTLLRTNGRDHKYYKQYIGAIFDSEQERFEWESTGYPLNYTSWADGEPSPVGPDGQREDCVVIEKARDYNMNNVDCSDNAGFICEDVRKQLTPQPEECDEITDLDEQRIDLEEIVNESTTPTTDNINEIAEIINKSTTQQTDYLDENTDIANESTTPQPDYLDEITDIVNESTTLQTDYLDEITDIINETTTIQTDYLDEITEIVNKSATPQTTDLSEIIDIFNPSTTLKTDDLDEINDIVNESVTQQTNEYDEIADIYRRINN